MISTNLKKRFFTSIALFFLIVLIFSYNLILTYSLIVLGTLSILEFLHLTKKSILHKFYLFLSNLFFIIYIYFFCLIFFFFSNLVHFKIILFSILLGCIASDLGGYVFGKLFKGPKLTKISPKKTIAGAFGSLIFSIILMSVTLFYFTKNFSYLIIILALLVSISCQFGDLFFSFLKRKARMKDTGSFLPGHGGILDRIDGILFGVPMGLISLTLLF
jgi:phosphatidate cytidylyltransferase